MESSSKRSRFYDDTSLKKCNNKYFDYRDPFFEEHYNTIQDTSQIHHNKQHAPRQNSKSSKAATIVDRSTISTSQHNSSKLNKTDIHSTHQRSRQKKSVSALTFQRPPCHLNKYQSCSNKENHFSNNSFRTRADQNSNVFSKKQHNKSKAVEELKYYKKLCLNLRKRLTQLQAELDHKNKDHRQVIRELEGKLQKLAQQVETKLTQQQCHTQNNTASESETIKNLNQQISSLKSKLAKKDSNGQKYKKFYNMVAEGLSRLSSSGKQIKSKKDIMEQWQLVYGYLSSHNYRTASSDLDRSKAKLS